MSGYRAPLRDMQFALRELAGIEAIAALPGCEETLDVLDSVLEEAAAFAAGVLDPLNRTGDKRAAPGTTATSLTPPGFKEAYKKFADAGWIGLPVPAEYGGQGLPQILLGPTLEMWNAREHRLCQRPAAQSRRDRSDRAGRLGRAEAALHSQSRFREVDRHDVPDRAASRLGSRASAHARRARGRPPSDHADRRYSSPSASTTWRRTSSISCSRACPTRPKARRASRCSSCRSFWSNADGRSASATTSSARASSTSSASTATRPARSTTARRETAPSAISSAKPNRGLEYMFIMMNAARFSVGVQGIALADRAYQSALAYAKERVQGRDLKPRLARARCAIIKHPDVRRMLMWQKATIEAMRALAYVTAASLDYAQRHPDERVRKEHKAFVELMIPVVKGWCTENAVELCSTALQVFGGMGYIEETGIAQQYRDVRIITIYEGTTGIQALDLIGRKLLRDMGATRDRASARRWKQIAKECAAARRSRRQSASAKRSEKALATLNETSQWIGMNAMGDLRYGLRVFGAVSAVCGEPSPADGRWRAPHRSRRQKSPRTIPRPSSTGLSSRLRAFYAVARALSRRRGSSGRSSTARATSCGLPTRSLTSTARLR